MKFNKISNIDILIREAKYFNYSIPSLLTEKIVDFYLLERYSSVYIKDTSLKESIDNAINTLVPSLKEYLLDQLYLAIAGEVAVFVNLFSRVNNPLYKYIKDTLGSRGEYSMDSIRQIGYEYFNNLPKEKMIKELSETLSKTSIENVYREASLAWLLLFKAISISDISIAIDHIIDLEHNNGTIFERFPLIGNEIKGIKNLLHTKGLDSTDSWALYERASSSLKPMIASVIKENTGKGYDLYIPKEFTIEDKKKSIKYIEELLNYLVAIAYELSERINSDDFLFSIENFVQETLDHINGIKNQEDVQKFENLIYEKVDNINEQLKEN